MIKTFIIIKDNIKHIFDDVDRFKIKIKEFKGNNKKIGHELSVIKNNKGKWGIVATIYTDEEDNKRIHQANVDLFEAGEL